MAVKNQRLMQEQARLLIWRDLNLDQPSYMERGRI